MVCCTLACACAPAPDIPIESSIESTPTSVLESSRTPLSQPSDAVETDFTLAQPVLITSLGQSADLLMLTAIIHRLDISYISSATALPWELGEAKTVILVAGVSPKGLTASGITLADEQLRAEEWATALEEQSDCQVLVAHLGGNARRDNSTMSLAECVLPAADALLVVTDGDADGYFANYAADAGIPYFSAASVSELQAPLSRLFTDKE